MIIPINKNRAIGDVQYDFNQCYPFLKLDFYKHINGRFGSFIKQKLSKTALLNAAGNHKEGDLDITDAMIVGQLEKTFYNRFGMTVQVSRKSGTIWLETTMTDSWTLKQQNEHGRELSSLVIKSLPGSEMDDD